MKTYLFQVVVEPDGDEWFAYCPALRALGGATCGRTREDALRNIQEVVGMVVDSMREHGDPIPEGPGDQVQILEERVAVTV
jgi:predicted RNase H-like HicB family nuclease